ncbi:alkaline phosphatase family protein [Pleomorphovibrio marinus]|uniref:sulfatase/phosphatase domain-containing protein n=1 Tax=Pleomorphovibrio marinus TaxID=2164132 RepID=UPI000E0B9D7A|nr:sulfatase/phosphatase domain-containing protein [Pleomorphovibrio marinus]
MSRWYFGLRVKTNTDCPNIEAVGRMNRLLIERLGVRNGKMGDSVSHRILKAGKTTLWEGGIRVPGINRWHGKIKPGVREETLAGIVDILPTICEITGTALPEDRRIDGVSLYPVFKGKSLLRDNPLFWFYYPSRPACVIGDGDCTLIVGLKIDIPRDNLFDEEWVGLIKESERKNFRLYNIKEDARQEHEISSKHPQLL